MPKLGKRFDVVYDTAATMTTETGLGLLGRGGVFLDINPTPGKFIRSIFNHRLKPIVCTPRADILDGLARTAKEGKLRLPVAESVPLSEAIRLVTALEGGAQARREGPRRDELSVSRSHRLFDLMQVLRRHRGTVSGEVLAREAGVSLRTIRRDIATLQAMGADIDGEPGVGYILRPGFLLPPLSFTEEELQALVAGAQWVSRQTDDALALAAQNALAKIGGVLPPEMRRALDDDALYIGRQKEGTSGLDLAECGKQYASNARCSSSTRIRPVLLRRESSGRSCLAFVEGRRFIAGWCELREDFRLFRADRIAKATFLDDRYSRNRPQLVKEWRAQEDLRRGVRK
ncbi:HTH domain-containing protein [Ralstonia solanacearum]|uniref:HTH domain-containing protein n=1 Tax=Ralstonia solanacearum TaxID=305 RepID=UPI000AE7D30F|nr:HTH domain-containing protein [Ralstonia solanacearum]